jgi:hypothetical protein
MTRGSKSRGLRNSEAACFALCVAAVLAIVGCEKKSETGETRVSVKTGLAPGVDPMRSRTVAFSELVSMPEPPGVTPNDRRYEKARIPAFPNPLGLKEGDVVTVTGYLHSVTLMGDGDYNLRISASKDSADSFIVSEIPDDDDVSNSHLRGMVIATRDFIKKQILQGHDPARTPGTKLADAPAIELTGQLFFSDRGVGQPIAADSQGLRRATNWQIHPGFDVSFASKTGQ